MSSLSALKQNPGRLRKPLDALQRGFQFRRRYQTEHLAKQLGIEGVWLHDTRRSFSTNARRRGSSKWEVMKVTGHTTRSTFDRYNIVDEEDAREVIRRLEAGAASELARTEPEFTARFRQDLRGQRPDTQRPHR